MNDQINKLNMLHQCFQNAMRLKNVDNELSKAPLSSSSLSIIFALDMGHANSMQINHYCNMLFCNQDHDLDPQIISPLIADGHICFDKLHKINTCQLEI